MKNNQLYDLFRTQIAAREIVGSVFIVNDHGIMIDSEKTHYSLTHFDPDGKVVEKRLFDTLNAAALAAAMLKRELEQTTIFMPEQRFLQ